jgi:hypothetical protein
MNLYAPVALPRTEDEDPLAPARGIAIGIGIGIALWIAIGLGVWFIL